MELIASVSRSSGLEKGGDALKELHVQEEYREFIQGKLDSYWKTWPITEFDAEIDATPKNRVDAQENIMILYRKLREGIASTKRFDAFSTQVYETSLALSILFSAPQQTVSIASHLVPDLYVAASSSNESAVLVALLSHIVASYPSQKSFRELLKRLPARILPRDATAYTWIDKVATTLRRKNYILFDTLTRAPSLPDLKRENEDEHSTVNLLHRALHRLVSALRRKAGASSWLVLRRAYLELACQHGSETRGWLARSLSLHPLSGDVDAKLKVLDLWLEEKAKAGEVRGKEGVEGRWTICKVRT